MGSRLFCFWAAFFCGGLVPDGRDDTDASRGRGRALREPLLRLHGDELRAYSGGPAFDLRRLRADEHDRFVESVISGKDNMPSWYGLLKPQGIEAIWAYMVDRQSGHAIGTFRRVFRSENGSLTQQ